ncbi:hypothetical protein VULLAG_LOCUS3251 [Vulpes lagopus]
MPRWRRRCCRVPRADRDLPCDTISPFQNSEASDTCSWWVRAQTSDVTALEGPRKPVETCLLSGSVLTPAGSYPRGITQCLQPKYLTTRRTFISNYSRTLIHLWKSMGLFPPHLSSRLFLRQKTAHASYL